jgi:signal transduction histidine kinase
MLNYASGAAFVDGSGAVLAADAGFAAALGLAGGDPTGALRARAQGQPELAALLRGEGPDQIRLGADGAEPLELSRHRAAGGALLVVRTGRLQERLEDACRAAALSRLAAGVAHDIKNPLNAMALQLALLAEKLGAQPGAGESSGSHLASMRDQIARVDEVVRRYLDVVDPAAPLGYTDLGRLLRDVAALFGHEARRRRVDLVLAGPRAGPRTSCDPPRVGRLVLIVLAGAMAGTPDGGRIEATIGAEAGEAVLRVTHAAGDGAPDPGYDSGIGAAAARALGGSLAEERTQELVRLALRLPGIERT